MSILKILVKNKNEADEKTKELKQQGYNIITFYGIYRELEKGNNKIIIDKK